VAVQLVVGVQEGVGLAEAVAVAVVVGVAVAVVVGVAVAVVVGVAVAVVVGVAVGVAVAVAVQVDAPATATPPNGPVNASNATETSRVAAPVARPTCPTLCSFSQPLCRDPRKIVTIPWVVRQSL
jgi:hypothetical protein